MNKVIVVFHYPLYVFLTKKKIPGVKVVFLDEFWNIDIDFDYEEGRILSSKIDFKYYKLDNLFGFKNYFVLINEREDYFKGYLIKKFLAKTNPEAVVVGVKPDNKGINFANTIILNDKIYKEIAKEKIIQRAEGKALSVLAKHLIGKYVYIDKKTLDIIKKVYEYAPRKTQTVEFVDMEKIEEVDNFRITLSNDYLFSLVKINFPFLDKRKIFGYFYSLIREEDLTIKNGVFVLRNLKETKKYRVNKTFILRLLRTFTYLIGNKIKVIKYKIKYTDNYEEIYYSSMVNEEELNKFGINKYDVDFVINKKNATHIIKFIKDFVSLDKIYGYYSFYKTDLIINYLIKKRILYFNDNEIRLTESGKYLAKFLALIKNPLKEYIKLKKEISHIPSIRQINKLREIKPEIDFNSLTREEASKILDEYYSTLPPTSKQLELLKKLYGENIQVKNRQEASQKIFEKIRKKPTAKMLRLAEKISKECNIPLPKEIKEDRKAISSFISKYL